VVRNRIDALEDFRKQLEGADVDLLREMVKIFAEQLMGADADALCGADYGERSLDRINRPRCGSRQSTRYARISRLRADTLTHNWHRIASRKTIT